MAVGGPIWGLFQGALHCGVDYVTSRVNAWLYPRSRHWFFVGIGFDQALHMTLLFLFRRRRR